MRVLSAIVVALSFSLVGCGGGRDQNGQEAAPPPPPPAPPPAAGGGSVEVKLAPVGNSGVTGRATLENTPDGVEVVLELTSKARHPAHIHVGKCPKPEAYPTWSLPDVDQGRSETLLGTGLRGEPEPTVRDLRSKDYVINVHKSYAQAETYIACGEIPKG